jgi:Spy/CpxP family protein refolding chaperone
MKTRIAVVLLLCLAGPFRAWAQPQLPGEDPIAKNVFPPELVMKYSQDIGLDDRQRAAIKENVQSAQSKFLDAQWSLQEESQKLVRLLQAQPVNETAVLAQVDKVLALEREIKRTQITLLVRIKNLLTEPQQAKLQELRKRGD